MTTKEIQILFDRASQVVQANILALLQREQVGLSKYGCTCDRQDLSLEDWLTHALEETLGKANYLRAAINKLDTSGDNTLSNTENPPASNAEGLPQNSIPSLIYSLLSQMDDKQLRATINGIAARNPTLLKLLSSLIASAEGNFYLKNPNESLPPDFMLRIIGNFDKDGQRDLLAKGLEKATGETVTFRKINSKN